MLKTKLKRLIKKFDLFSQPVTFRYNQQPQYESLTGGICSIIICIVFVVVFSNAVLGTFRKDKIVSSIVTTQQQDPSYYTVGTDSFMFAVGLSGIDLNQGDMWFDIYLQKRIYTSENKTKTNVPLQECTKQQWTIINQNFSQLYDKLGFDTWLCPVDGTIIQLQGKFSSNIFKYYKFGVKKCNTTKALQLNRTCVNTTTIQNFLNANQTFTFNFYYVNTILNPSSHDFLSHYLDDLNYFPFTPTDGMTANFFLSSYQINTDQSIYPLQSYDELKGGISTTPTQLITYKIRQKDYLKLYIRKSSLSLIVQRSFGKLDDTLSYIGGLFSFIVSAALLLKIYNQFSYQLEIAKNLYHYDKNFPIQSDGFNFFTFLGYLVYDVLSTINIKLPWKKMQIYDHSLEQVRKQMDIRLIMKKILYSERMAIAVFDQPKAKILHLQEPLTLEEAEQIRKDHRFYQKLSQKYFDYQKIRQDQSKGYNVQDFNNATKGEQSNQNFKNNESQKQLNKSNKKNQSQTSILLNQLFFGQKQNQNQNNTINVDSQNLIKQQSSNENKNKNKNKSSSSQQQKNLKPIHARVQQKRRKNTQKKKMKQITSILNLVISKQDQKKNQLDCMITQMKQHIKILKKQAQNGDIISQNILSRFDPKLMKLFIYPDQNNMPNYNNQQNKQIISKQQKSINNEQLIKKSRSALSNFTVNLGVDQQIINQNQIKIQTENGMYGTSNKLFSN